MIIKMVLKKIGSPVVAHKNQEKEKNLKNNWIIWDFSIGKVIRDLPPLVYWSLPFT